MNAERKSPLPSQPRVAAKLGSGIVKILDELVNMAVLTILLLLLIYGSFVLWQTNRVYQAANSQEYVMYRPSTTDEGMSFATLQQLNPDVFS